MNQNSRYNGKPLLRLMECYVLDAIGHLTQSDEANLQAMTPTLAHIYQQQGTWNEILAATMALPPDLPQKIAALWQRNQEIADAHGIELAPQSFAEMFVDQNLAN